jgi:hypothetical protein
LGTTAEHLPLRLACARCDCLGLLLRSSDLSLNSSWPVGVQRAIPSRSTIQLSNLFFLLIVNCCVIAVLLRSLQSLNKMSSNNGELSKSASQVGSPYVILSHNNLTASRYWFALFTSRSLECCCAFPTRASSPANGALFSVSKPCAIGTLLSFRKILWNSCLSLEVAVNMCAPIADERPE